MSNFPPKVQEPLPDNAQSLIIDIQLREIFDRFPFVRQALLFGTVASGLARAGSDLDIAVAGEHPLTIEERISLIGALAEHFGRAVDLIDLDQASEPLLGQILRHGRRILGSDTLYGGLINRHVLAMADFMPYRKRILAERRMAWIGK